MDTKGSLLISLSSIFLFLILFQDIVASQETCPSIRCSNNEPKISYPFGIKDFQGVQCGYNPGFNLTCNSLGETVIDNLPFFAGKFLVRDIDYHHQEIRIQDPDNCLPRRYLQNLNDGGAVSTSPLKAYTYQKHTFFSCSASSMATSINRYSAYFKTVGCLSSSEQTVLVTVSTANNVNININKILMDSGYCEVIDYVSIPIPKPFNGSVYDLTKDDLYLSWGETPPLRRDLQQAEGPGQDNGQNAFAPNQDSGNNAADSPPQDGGQGGGDNGQGGSSGGGGDNGQGGSYGGGGDNGQGGGSGGGGGGDNGQGGGSGGGGSGEGGNNNGQRGSSGGGGENMQGDNSEIYIIIGICVGVGVMIIVLVIVCCCNNRKIWKRTVDLIILGLNVLASLHGVGCCFRACMRCFGRKTPNLGVLEQVGM